MKLSRAIIDHSTETVRAILIAKSAYVDIHDMSKPLELNQQKVDINVTLKSDLHRIAKDEIAWYHLSYSYPATNAKITNAIQNALYGIYKIYPNKDIKYLDQAIHTHNISDYNQWLSRLGKLDSYSYYLSHSQIWEQCDRVIGSFLEHYPFC